jgi:hypothetical protein
MNLCSECNNKTLCVEQSSCFKYGAPWYKAKIEVVKETNPKHDALPPWLEVVHLYKDKTLRKQQLIALLKELEE